ncbi:MAG: hypothetical protein GYB64_09020 [Chloroflexi bacterium]|nr:hypothetical protein [Chloroflexota bacterium]
MNVPSLKPPTIIDSVADIDTLRRGLQGVTRFAVDTESNSMHAYQEQVCLIQISTDEADFVVDPLRLDVGWELDFLGEALADPQIEIILHAAEYDLAGMRRDFGFDISNLFDTMVAARILGWEQFGLANILMDRYGIHVDKKYQLADWAHRPLSGDELFYAQLDTHFLLDLRDDLYVRLAAGDHLEEANELFGEVIAMAPWPDPNFDPDGFWSISGARHLNSRQAAILRELYLYRDEQARQADVPVYKIIPDKALVIIARNKPTKIKHLRRIRRLRKHHVENHGRAILAAVDRGMNAEPPEHPPVPSRPADEILERYDLLHTWRKERAEARGVSSEIIMPKSALWYLARNPPSSLADLQAVDEIGPWRLRTYGAELLNLFVTREWSET